MTRFAGQHALVVFAVIAAMVAAAIPFASSLAVHEGDTRLTFEPVADSPSPGGAGTGLVAYAGGREPESRWTITMQFTGLAPDTEYVALVAGRFGEDGSPEATAITPICGFRADAAGSGGCWYYLVGLRRLSLVELRLGDEAGQTVLQAAREEGEPGSMTGTANEHSFALTAVPPDAAGTPAATPRATP